MTYCRLFRSTFSALLLIGVAISLAIDQQESHRLFRFNCLTGASSLAVSSTAATVDLLRTAAEICNVSTRCEIQVLGGTMLSWRLDPNQNVAEIPELISIRKAVKTISHFNLSASTKIFSIIDLHVSELIMHFLIYLYHIKRTH